MTVSINRERGDGTGSNLNGSYSSKIEDTIDCVVMGYDAGKGKRTDFGIGAFLVGVYDNKQENYVTIAKNWDRIDRHGVERVKS